MPCSTRHSAFRVLQPAIDHAQRSAIALPADTEHTASQASNDAVAYEFTAAAGNTCLIEIEQRGLDFIVTLANPSGAALPYNSPLKRDGIELVLVENAFAGTYRVTVESRDATRAAM